MGPEPLRQPPAARPAKQPRVGWRAVAEEGDALAQNGTHKPEVAGAEWQARRHFSTNGPASIGRPYSVQVK